MILLIIIKIELRFLSMRDGNHAGFSNFRVSTREEGEHFPRKKKVSLSIRVTIPTINELDGARSVDYAVVTGVNRQNIGFELLANVHINGAPCSRNEIAKCRRSMQSLTQIFRLLLLPLPSSISASRLLFLPAILIASFLLSLSFSPFLSSSFSNLLCLSSRFSLFFSFRLTI